MSSELQNSKLTKDHVGTGALVRLVEGSTTPLSARASAILKGVFLFLTLATFVAAASAQTLSNGIMGQPSNMRPPHLENVGIDQHLDAQIPPNLTFTDDTGRSVMLGEYFGKKPLILNLVYFQCTMLCGEELAGLTSAMKLIRPNAANCSKAR